MKESKYLIGVHVSGAGGIEKVPQAGEELGCRAVQIFTKNNMQWFAKEMSLAEVKAFRENLSETKIEIVFSHSGYLINLASPDQENHDKSMKSMRQELERADQLGLPFVVLHPGSHKDKGVEWGVGRVAQSINTLFEKTHRLKVGIALETTAGQGSYIGQRFEELARIRDMVEEKSRIGFCFDTCHTFAAGYDQRDEGGFTKTWKEFDAVIGIKNLLAIHLNDSVYKLNSHKDRHAHIGKGEMGLFPFWRLLHDDRFEKIPMVLETPKGEVDGEDLDVINLGVLRGLERAKTFS